MLSITLGGKEHADIRNSIQISTTSFEEEVQKHQQQEKFVFPAQ